MKQPFRNFDYGLFADLGPKGLNHTLSMSFFNPGNGIKLRSILVTEECIHAHNADQAKLADPGAPEQE